MKKKPHHKGGCHENKVEEKKVKGKKVKGKKHHEKDVGEREAPQQAGSSRSSREVHLKKRLISIRKNVQQAQLQSVENLSAEDAFFISTKDASLSTSEAGGIQDSFNIDNLFSGYIGYFTQEIVDLIRQNPLVDFVERDSPLSRLQNLTLKNSAPWGLARISHRERLNLGVLQQVSLR
ncbi:CKB_collapsed_G0014270.mRNA.1.CDS.1 [Saccharomyces cerevisiae]|nr:CKB_collapsed_G0014270.mRNA.1.CDS.1 [Saccharomyces cerevisiae]